MTAKISMGLCSWTDPELVKSGKFYSKMEKSGIEKLRFYSRNFPCVEIDTSTYAIPTIAQTTSWVQAVARKQFLFHVKAYNIFCDRPVDPKSLPHAIKEQLSDPILEQESVALVDLAPEIQERLWCTFVDVLNPFVVNNMMGVVLFQFQAHFTCNDENKKHILDCMKRMAPLQIAVELRNPRWFDPTNKQETLSFLKRHNIGMVIVDEPGMSTIIEWVKGLTINRREGEHRLLSQDGLVKWKEDLKSLCGQVNTPEGVYLMWNTNHLDQSIVNARNLLKIVDDPSVFVKCLEPETSIASFFKSQPTKDAATPESTSAPEHTEKAQPTEQPTPQPASERILKRSADSGPADSSKSKKAKVVSKKQTTSKTKNTTSIGQAKISSFLTSAK